MTQVALAARKKKAYHHGNLKRALLDAALERIAAEGAPSFTLRELATRVGVTHPAAYRHFEDKRALLVAIALEGLAELEESLVRVAEEQRGAARSIRVTEIVRAYVAFARTRPAHYRVMFGPRLNRDGRFPELEATLERAYLLLYRALGGTGESMRAADRPGHDRVFAVWSFAHGYASLLADGRLPISSRESSDKHVARLVDLWLSGSIA